MTKDTADYIRGISNALAISASLLIFNDMRSNVEKLSDNSQKMGENIAGINKTLEHHSQKLRDIDSDLRGRESEREDFPTGRKYSLYFSPVKNYSSEELKYLHMAEEKIETTLRSQCATDFFAKRKMIETKGRSGPEVLEHLRSLKGSVPVRMYYSNNRVVGYRNVGSPTVHTNRKFHAGSTACNRASNLSHEALGHILGGYSHAYKATKSRPYSVPYSLNALFSACCK